MTLAVRVVLNELGGSRWLLTFSAELDRLSCGGYLTPSRMLRATSIF